MRDDRAKCALNVAEYHAQGVEPAASDFALAHLQALIKALDETGVLPLSPQESVNARSAEIDCAERVQHR